MYGHFVMNTWFQFLSFHHHWLFHRRLKKSTGKETSYTSSFKILKETCCWMNICPPNPQTSGGFPKISKKLNHKIEMGVAWYCTSNELTEFTSSKMCQKVYLWVSGIRNYPLWRNRRPEGWNCDTRSRIYERTISLRFLGIILRVLSLEVSVYNVYITNQFQTLFQHQLWPASFHSTKVKYEVCPVSYGN